MVIQQLTVFVSVDKEGNEGVIGQIMGNTFMPFVCADPERVKSLLPLAMAMSKNNGIPFKILKFTNREEITGYEL